MATKNYKVKVFLNSPYGVNDFDIKKPKYNTSLSSVDFGDQISTPPASLMDGGILSYELMNVSTDQFLLRNAEVVNAGIMSNTMLSGSAFVASDPISLYVNDYVHEFGKKAVKGVKLKSFADVPYVAILKRINGKVSSAVEYQYIKNIKNSESRTFTEYRVSDTEKYCVVNIEKPLSIFELNGSNVQIEESDFFDCTFDYNRLVAKTGMNHEAFLTGCDYISIKDLNLTAWGAESAVITLKTKYFPVYKHVSVIVESDMGLTQLPIDFTKDVDQLTGIITLTDPNVIKGSQVKGFYLVYGTYPIVVIGSGEVEEKIYNDSSENAVSMYEVAAYDDAGNVSISNTLINIEKSAVDTPESAIVYMPKKYGSFFIEPSASLIINNTLVHGGEKLYITNELKNTVEFKPSGNLIDLMSIVQSTQFQDKNIVDLGAAISPYQCAIYGLFETTTVSRVSMASLYLSDQKTDSVSTISASGYSEGPYSSGSFGNGIINTFNSRTTYSVSTLKPTFISPRDMLIDVEPSKDGYQYILPAWTTLQEINVFEFGKNEFKPFKEWTYVEPDILILDRKHVNLNGKYRIVFKCAVAPVVEELDINANKLIFSSSVNFASVYPSTYKALLVLANKLINVRIGYVDSAGNHKYFRPSLQVMQQINKDHFLKTVTGHKTIIF